MRIVWIGALLALTLGSNGLHSQPSNPLVGAWRVAEIVSPSGDKNSNPQPTIYIFTRRHYSHVSVTSAQPRPNYTGPNVSDAQRVEMWQSFSATAGIYDFNANEFTIRPTVAKNPGFMDPGSFTTFELTTESKDIWIRATKANTGSISPTNANRVRLVRLE
jgi:hypothetical protein